MYIIMSHCNFPMIDIPMFNLKYLENAQSANAYWYNEQVIVWFYVCASVLHSPKLVDYLPVRTHKPYNNSCVDHAMFLKTVWIQM